MTDQYSPITMNPAFFRASGAAFADPCFGQPDRLIAVREGKSCLIYVATASDILKNLAPFCQNMPANFSGKILSEKGFFSLPGDECARAEKLSLALRPSFLAGRFLLRALLSFIFGDDRASASFVYSANGQPMMGGKGDDRLFFSISHSGQGTEALVGLALSAMPVGFDLERGRSHNWQRIAKRRFSAIEAADLERLYAQSPAGAVHHFRSVWALKEAVVKLKDDKLLRILKEDIIDFSGKDPKIMGQDTALGYGFEAAYDMFFAVAALKKQAVEAFFITE